tara:strand:- start:103 stop:660 length:558 start_codon:yes stop_codon:yes gene_type:complete
MKNFYYIILILFLASSGCKDKQEQLCEGVVCENGGDCINGDCDCLEGYDGPSCGSQITPSRIRILSITIAKFPLFEEDGSSWDIGSAPDLTLAFSRGSTLIHEQPTQFKNATGENSYRYTPSTPIDITSPNDRHVISLYDYDDLGANDFMGGVEFTPYNNQNDFPESLDVTFGNVGFVFQLGYDW